MIKSTLKKENIKIMCEKYPEFLNAISELGITFIENDDTEFLCFPDDKQASVFYLIVLFFEIGLKQNEK